MPSAGPGALCDPGACGESDLTAGCKGLCGRRARAVSGRVAYLSPAERQTVSTKAGPAWLELLSEGMVWCARL